MIKNLFEKDAVDEIIARINKLSPTSKANWGKMAVGQMLAHCNVTYEMIYENKHPNPNAFLKFILKLLVKKTVVNEVPYKHNSSTAPQFIIKDTKDFDLEKNRLINYIKQTQSLGDKHFEGMQSHSFGALTSKEWNNMFYKHLDHHLNQFGV